MNITAVVASGKSYCRGNTCVNNWLAKQRQQYPDGWTWQELLEAQQQRKIAKGSKAIRISLDSAAGTNDSYLCVECAKEFLRQLAALNLE